MKLASLSGRRVVLTGATGGIGRAIAARLAEEGAALIVTGRRAAQLDELRRSYGVVCEAGDLTDPAVAKRLAGRVSSEWPEGPDVLINSAGAFELAPAVSTKPGVLERLLAINLQAPYDLIRCWLPEMVDRKRGQIVNVGSIAGRRAFPANSAYSATKYGLRGLHEVLVEELRGSGVRVAWIEPSAVDTPLWDHYAPDGRDDLPSRAEMLSPEAVAEAVHFVLAQPEAVAIEEIVIRSNR